MEARLVDGTVYIEQADGTWQEAEDKTDLDYLRSLTDEEIERMAEEDGTADIPDYVSTVRPYEPAE
ncbi:MAG: hypothetical protein SV201_14235 [Pseudomonadota bacterium]|nr:hypothetical protein [Pseudomonadota bacterium]